MSNKPNPNRSRASVASARNANSQRTVWIVVVVVVVVAGALIVALASGSSNSSKSTGKSATDVPTGAAKAAIIKKATTVPASVFEAVGAGTAKGAPAKVTGPELKSGGKPEVFFYGAEYCPFCATQRWGIVTALSRFGTFSNLGLTHSSSTDTDPNTATLTFHGSSYASPYFTFVSVEGSTNKSDGNGGYTTLETPTKEQQALLQALDPSGTIPFIDVANRFAFNGVSYDAAVLQGKTWAEISSQLSQPKTAVSKGAIGTANQITAAICEVTGGKPGSVCSTPAIKALRAKL